MVSTRQSSNVAGSEVNNSVDAVAQPPPTSGIKTRHTSAQLQQDASSSPTSPPHGYHEHPPPAVSTVSASASLSSPTSPPYVGTKKFLDLPVEIMDKIFSYTGYKTVAQTRLVCRQLDKICGAILNSTFQKLQTQMLHRFQNIKNKMPRRESARRNHPLACESDIIETLHMRLTLLQMSFGKHIERKHCCFFAGEILDEVYRILHYIKVTPKLARPYRVTDELFDLSTMAMEYFKEHIEPTLPEIAYFGTDFFDFPGGLQQSPPHSSKVEYESSGPGEDRPAEPPASSAENSIVMRKRMRKIRQGLRRHNDQLLLLKREYRSFKSKLTEQAKQFHEFVTRMDDYDKKNEETSRKFSTLLQELNKCKTELQYWRSKSPFTSFCLSCSKMTPGSATIEELQAWAATSGFPPSFFWNSVGEPLACGPHSSSSNASSSTVEPQPSTSSAGLLDVSSAAAPAVEMPPMESAQQMPATVVVSGGKQATKRRGAALLDDASVAPRKQKRPRAVMKARSKRS